MPRTAVRLVVALALLVALASCRSRSRDEATEARPAGPRCPPADALAEGRSRHVLTSGGVERSYLVHVPKGIGDAAVPVVFNLHGFGSSADQQLAYTGVEPVADRERFVVVAPNGSGSPSRFDLFGAGDVDFINQIIEELAKSVCIDRTRIYSMGMSNGAAMSAVLACRSGGAFAAVAPVAAVVYGEVCDAAPRTPVISFMGTDDPVVPFAGGRVNCCGNPTIGGAPEAMASWAAHNGCDPEPATERIGPDVERRTWTGCDEGADTVFHVVEGGGHTWPGAVAIARLGKTTESVEATDAIWAFFSAHARPAG